ncbi:MAG: hypothetical protein HQM10_10035 [Candidatus Riflebacteria bacterium]|nr:hypothetical protein [Candidatus Riflebacteria bacterium]
MNIVNAFSSIAFFTILSRVSGFARVAVFAAYFGTGVEADIFLSVMILPELMYKFISDGLITGAAIPMFVRREPGTKSERNTFWTLFWGISMFSLIPVALNIILAESICTMMVPGFLPETQLRMAQMWREMSLYIVFSLWSSLLTSFLNARKIFGPPAVGPFLVNSVVIAGILLMQGRGIENLVIFVLCGIALQTLWLFLLTGKFIGKFVFPWSGNFFNYEVWEKFKQKTIPIAMWLILTPVIPLWERFLLSKQGIGMVSILNYSDKLIYLPLGVISLSLASAVFPGMSESDSVKRLEILQKSFWWGLFVLLLPVTVIFYSCSDQIIQIVFARGKFQQFEILSTSGLLSAYSLFLIPASAVMLLNRFFYSEGYFRLTFIVGVISVVVQVAADTILVDKIGWIGVGYGAALGSSVQMVILCFMILWVKKIFSGLKSFFMPLLSAVFMGMLQIVILKSIWPDFLSLFPAGKTGFLIGLVIVWLITQTVNLLLYLLARRVGLVTQVLCVPVKKGDSAG